MVKALIILSYKVVRLFARNIFQKIYGANPALAYKQLRSKKLKNFLNEGDSLLPELTNNLSIDPNEIRVFGHKVKRGAEFELSDFIRGDEIKAIINKLNPGYSPIAWSVDPKVGFKWDNQKFYTDISLFDGNEVGSDIKRPWELGRFCNAHLLATAGNDREVLSRILDFCITQTPFHGVHWKCAMDVGIRAINWILVLPYLMSCLKKYDMEKNEQILIRELISSYLYKHYIFIILNLEYIKNGKSNNHFLANVSALVCLAAFFEKKHSIKVFRKLLCNTVKKQFHKDGVNFEGSMPYHKLSYELLAWAVLVDWEYNAIQSEFKNFISRVYSKPAVKHFYVIHAATKSLIAPTNEFPNIGDNDSGVVTKLIDVPARFHIQTILMLEQLLLASQNQNLSKVMLEVETWSVKHQHLSKPILLHYKTAGFVVATGSGFYFIMHHGNGGQNGNCGHDHSDRLSFELWMGGKKVVTDRGSYCYTTSPMKRNLFRSIRSHNLPTFNADNQFLNTKLFSREMLGQVNLLEIAEVYSGKWKLVCEFESKEGKTLFKRKFFIDAKESRLQVLDSFFEKDSKGGSRSQVYLSAKPEIPPKAMNYVVKGTLIAPEYGRLNKAYRLDYTSNEISFFIENEQLKVSIG